VGMLRVRVRVQMQNVGMQVVEGAVGLAVVALSRLKHQYCGQKSGP